MKVWTTTGFLLKQLDYSLSISMHDSWLGHDIEASLELRIQLFNRNTRESLEKAKKTLACHLKFPQHFSFSKTRVSI